VLRNLDAAGRGRRIGGAGSEGIAVCPTKGMTIAERGVSFFE
jgi:hypothetical protein